MGKLSRRATSTPDFGEWFQSIGVRREDGRLALPVLDRCATCRSAEGCGECPGCRSGQICHRLPPCPSCGLVQEVPVERLHRHPLHRELYGETPESEVFNTSNGAIFLQSVAAVGIIEPILGLEAEEDDETGARPGDILVLSGWRRALAARACQFPTVPVRLVDPAALPRRADVNLVVVSANLQRQKTFDEIRAEVQVWKQALAQASIRQPRTWELRAAVAKVMGISVRTVEQIDAIAARDRLAEAEKRLGLPELSPRAEADDGDVIARLRQELQPGDLRGSDIISAMNELGEPLLSAERDEVVHESISRAAQTAAGTFILDVEDAPPFWPEDVETDASRGGRHGQEGIAVDDQVSGRLAPPAESSIATSASQPIRIHNLTVYRGDPDALPFAELPSVDLIVAAPSWLEPMARPLLTPGHVQFVEDWADRLQRCLVAWRRAIRPGGRLLLIVPVATPLHPGMPVLLTAIEQLRATGWAIGGTLVLHDPNLHGPAYAAPHQDQVLPPCGPARLVLAAAPVLEDLNGPIEDQWRRSWQAPLPGRQPRDVAAVEEAALNHLWKYTGPGRRSRWLPEFHPGLLYHLVRVFSRPDATVLLPELGSANVARGCLRTGRQVIALAGLPEQIDHVVGRIRRDVESSTLDRDEPGALIDVESALIDDEDAEDDDDI